MPYNTLLPVKINKDIDRQTQEIASISGDFTDGICNVYSEHSVVQWMIKPV